MNEDAFSSFHPAVSLLYFTFSIGFTVFLTHPICLGISLLCAFIYSVRIKGKRAVRFNMLYMLPTFAFSALLNPAFNHQGATILAYLPSGNPLTLESILYGLAASAMLVASISWFSCFNAVMTSDKFVYLFGRIIPSLSLVLAMALRFAPLFTQQIKVISYAQKCVGRNGSNENFLRKMMRGVKILSIMTTWALENAIETADSMKCRGYGLPGRTAFSVYRFQRRDAWALALILAFASIAIAGSAIGASRFRYFPTVKGEWTGINAIIAFAAYIGLCSFPILVNIKEDIVWKRIKLNA
ncbi:MAG: energy-coupling factor transporter transmembrane protein EcfT [Clostridiales bacterium]|jgi:energy-coupling factor transport system permease protein|nr:energy-coupling factor transporter transmembrane protein EcfT [Clostridiales bacterium]